MQKLPALWACCVVELELEFPHLSGDPGDEGLVEVTEELDLGRPIEGLASSPDYPESSR